MKKEHIMSLLELRPFLFLNEDFIPLFKEIENDLTVDDLRHIYFHVSALIEDVCNSENRGIIYHIVNEFKINLSKFIKVSKLEHLDITTSILYLTAIDKIIPLYKYSTLIKCIDVPTSETINKLKRSIDQLEEDGHILNIDVSKTVDKLNTILHFLIDYFDIEMEEIC